MKLWIKTLFKNIVALAILIPIGTFAGYNYYQMINSKIRGVGDPIGLVTEKNYYPKRQLQNDEYISTLSENDSLFDGDRVKSDAFSSVLMDLVDGSEISLENGSEVILHLKDDTIYFSGTISISASEGRETPLILIDMNDENAKPIILNSSTELTLATDEKGVFRMSVLSGEASRDGEVVKENEQFQIAPTGEVQVQALSYILKSPANNSRFITFEELQPIRFTWDEPNPQETRSLWVAKDANFERVVYKIDDLKERVHEVKLEEGDYFWRVGSESADQYSSIGKILIQENQPLAATSPAPGTIITYRSKLPSQTFLWRGTETANLWRFELATSQTMNAPILTETLPYIQLKIDDLDEGDYWWRVTALYNEADNITEYPMNTPQKLVISQNVLLEPPQLLSPDNNGQVSPANLREGFRFSWKGDSEYSGYEIALSENEDMSNPFFVESTEKTYANIITSVDSGEYFWQVSPTTESSFPISPSETRKFVSKEKILELNPLYPLSGTPLELDRGSTLTFKWDSTHEESYRFRLWQLVDNNERSIANSGVSRLEVSQYIPDRGDYVWQVDLLDKENRVILEGNKQFFSIEYPLLPPQIIYPSPESQVTMIGETTLNLSWTEVMNSEGYALRVLREAVSEPVYTVENQRETLASIDVSQFQSGKYTIELQSKRADQGKGFSTESAVASSAFFLDEVVNYNAPIFTEPEQNALVNRLDLLEGGLPIKWTSSFPFPSYEFVLKQANSGAIILKQTLVGNEYTLSDLYAGSYTIEVLGKDTKGRLSPVGSRDIRILPVASLSAPTVLFPALNQVIDMSDRNSIEFIWEQETEGELYNISLQDSQRNIIFSLRNYKLNSFTFNDLSKLDIGQFIFTIESVKEYRNSGIKRESDTSQIFFEITIRSDNNAPTILSPEVQYAD